jgi:hypothetical protein
VRNPTLALAAATFAMVLVIAVVLFAQVSGLRSDVADLAAAVGTDTPTEVFLNELDGVDARLDALSAKVDALTVRFDRLDASIAQLPTETENRSQIGSILSEVQALQEILGGLSLDLGIVCDVVGC